MAQGGGPALPTRAVWSNNQDDYELKETIGKYDMTLKIYLS